MNYPYTSKPPVDRIQELRARIQVLEWSAISGETETWYAYNEIGRMEQEIEALQELICDALIGEKDEKVFDDYDAAM